MGIKLRSLTANNAGSNQTLKMAQDSKDALLDFGINTKDDLFTQALFVRELEQILKPEASTGLAGTIDEVARTGIQQGMNLAVQQAAQNRVMQGIQRMRGINPDAALKSADEYLKSLLRELEK